jgi:nucleotide-binding universal stress UspA family protein
MLPLSSSRLAAHAAVRDEGEALIRAGVDAQARRARRYTGMVREIVKDVQEHHAGIIILGSRGRGDLAGLVPGSTAHKVIHLTDRQVLVVR